MAQLLYAKGSTLTTVAQSMVLSELANQNNSNQKTINSVNQYQVFNY